MGKFPGIKMASGALRRILDSDEQGRREGGRLGHFALGPTLLMTRGSHSHRSYRTICDRDQNEIKRSRGYLDQNKAIKERFK